MPTTLPRHAITETPPVASMLDDAADVWPGVSRADLLRRLLDLGHAQIATVLDARRSQRVAMIKKVSGSMPSVWPADAAMSLRDEWPR